MAAVLAAPIWAEEAKPETPKPATPVDAPTPDVPKVDGELPKAPEGVAPLAAQSESLVGAIHKGGALNPKGKVKKNSVGNPDAIVLSVVGEKVKGEKGRNRREVTLSATGDLLTQLTTLADQKKQVKVTGTLTGETMTVKEVSEVPGGGEKMKKKKKDNA